MPNGNKIFWEHLGMLSNDKYSKDWERKKLDYEAGGISESDGNLIITEDKRNGGIDTQQIAKIVKEIS